MHSESLVLPYCTQVVQQPSKACKMQAISSCRTGKHVIATVWSHAFDVMARRLGIVYCMNRPCSLYCAPVPSSEVCLLTDLLRLLK